MKVPPICTFFSTTGAPNDLKMSIYKTKLPSGGDAEGFGADQTDGSTSVAIVLRAETVGAEDETGLGVGGRFAHLRLTLFLARDQELLGQGTDRGARRRKSFHSRLAARSERGVVLRLAGTVAIVDAARPLEWR